jgi:hypothetical protein
MNISTAILCRFDFVQRFMLVSRSSLYLLYASIHGKKESSIISLYSSIEYSVVQLYDTTGRKCILQLYPGKMDYQMLLMLIAD